LTPEVTARLRSPLDNLQKDVIAEEFDDRSDQNASASSIAQTAPIEVTTTRNDEMALKAQKATATSPSAKKGRPAGSRELTQQAKAHVSAKVSRPTKAELQQFLELAAEPSVPEIRRANLHVLTARNGSKALLSRLLNLSQSNMAHRLHGKKRLDDAEAERFTTALGLPSGWLDIPRELADVPAAVTETLTPTSRRQSTSLSSRSATTAEDTSAIIMDRGNVQGAESIDHAVVQAERLAKRQRLFNLKLRTGSRSRCPAHSQKAMRTLPTRICLRQDRPRCMRMQLTPFRLRR
jgi:hypothetical protein